VKKIALKFPKTVFRSIPPDESNAAIGNVYMRHAIKNSLHRHDESLRPHAQCGSAAQVRNLSHIAYKNRFLVKLPDNWKSSRADHDQQIV
jgi:hypothetical protein